MCFSKTANPFINQLGSPILEKNTLHLQNLYIYIYILNTYIYNYVYSLS